MKKILNSRVSHFVMVTMLAAILLAGCSRRIENSISPPINDSTIPPTPANLYAEIGDGFVVLSWSISDASLVSSYNIYRADSSGANYLYIGNSETETYMAVNLQNGLLYYFGVRSLSDDGFEGYMSGPVSAVPELYAVSINNGSEHTNDRNVLLNLTAPVNTRFIQISDDSSFAESQWEAYFSNRDFRLSHGDGVKIVYCRFRDFSDVVAWGYYSDSIILDTEALIDSVGFSPSGPFSAGEIVHFTVYTGESEGNATVIIGANIAEVDLFDNGQRGDAVAEDGLYELDFTVPAAFDFENEIVSGDFTDRAGNVATEVQAGSNISVRLAPVPVTLFNVSAPPGYYDRLNLNWGGSSAPDFAQYRIYRGVSPGVDSTDFLVAAIFSRNQTSAADTGLTENTYYYYKVYVEDITGLWSGSNEAGALTNQDSPPAAVDLYPVIIYPDYYQEVEIEWSESPDIDFNSYRLFRWQEDIGRSDSFLVAFVTERSNTIFTDQPSFNTSDDTVNFWYILYVYDDGGNSAPSDSVRIHLADDAPPQVSGSVAASDSSLLISWSDPEVPDFGNYRLLRDTDDNPSGAITIFITSSQTTLTYDDDSTIEAQTYYYWLDIYDLRGNSSRSILGSGTW